MTIFDLEKTSPYKNQADFARWVTFNFNPELVEAIVPSIMNSANVELYMIIIKNKHMLSKDTEPIQKFFDKVDVLAEQSDDEEVLKIATKSGLHIARAKTLLTSDEEFVSKNEMDYLIRDHNLPMNIYNVEFSFMNEDLKTKAIACRQHLVNVIREKDDVESVAETTVTMVNGDIYKLIVLS